MFEIPTQYQQSLLDTGIDHDAHFDIDFYSYDVKSSGKWNSLCPCRSRRCFGKHKRTIPFCCIIHELDELATGYNLEGTTAFLTHQVALGSCDYQLDKNVKDLRIYTSHSPLVIALCTAKPSPTLVDKRCIPTVKPQTMRTHESVRGGYLQAIGLVEDGFNSGCTQVICAAENGHESAVRLLLEKGADLDLTILILVSQLSNLQNALWNHVEGQKDRPHIFAGPYYWDKQSQVPCFASQNLQLQRAQPVPEYTPESVQCPQGCFLYGLSSGARISITSRLG
ncbi:unnamed protein product [Aspergillus oryzae]|nr:unnamed protein product [Aspergillus oryzae]